MTCTRIHMGDGITAIVCTRGQRRARCAVCKRAEATKLCDFPLSGRKAGKTCDRKLCDACAAVQPVAVLPTPGSTVDDTIDYCPAHHRLASKPAAKPEAKPQAAPAQLDLFKP